MASIFIDSDLILIAWPFITAGSGQTLIEKDNTVLLPVDRFDPVLLSAAEKKETVVICIHL